MKKIFLTKLFYAVLIFQTALIGAFAQTANSVKVYDGRTYLKSARVNAADEKIIKAEVEKNASVLRENVNVVCDEEAFSIVDATAGAFTKSGAPQKAFLYEFCRSGRSFGIGGIVIFENGKIVSHYAYGENGLYAGLTALPDINQNETQEIVLVGVGSGQGFTSTVIEICEIAKGNLNFLGNADVYDDNYGTGKRKAEASAQNIFVQKSAAPVFTRESYVQKGEKAKWILTRKAQKFSLDKTDTPKFFKVL